MSMLNELGGVERGKKKENFFIRVVKYLFPYKGDDFAEVFRKIVFLGAICLFGLSINQVIDYYEVDKEEVQRGQEIANLAPDFSDDEEDNGENFISGEPVGDNFQGTTPNGNSDANSGSISSKWNALLEENPDTMGWIRIPTYIDENGEQYINYPVMYTHEMYELSGGESEDFYLHHNFDRHWTESGTLYIDDRCYVNSATDRSDNLVIYGHHMKRLGNMFTRLAEYKSGVEFLKQNPIISFDTLYTRNQQYIIVGCYISNIEESQDDGKLFDYWRYRNFDEEHTFEDFMAEIKKRSWYSSDIECTEDDDYITLSTCSNEAGQSKLRWVITARRVRVTDDIDALVESYRENDSVYFPKNWIKAKGNKKVYDGWWY